MYFIAGLHWLPLLRWLPDQWELGHHCCPLWCEVSTVLPVMVSIVTQIIIFVIQLCTDKKGLFQDFSPCHPGRAWPLFQRWGHSDHEDWQGKKQQASCTILSRMKSFLAGWYCGLGCWLGKYDLTDRSSSTPNTMASPSTTTSPWSSWPALLRWVSVCLLCVLLRPVTTSLVAWSVWPLAGVWPATMVTYNLHLKVMTAPGIFMF